MREHMTLGRFIEELKALNLPNRPIGYAVGIYAGTIDSNRGDYSQLSIGIQTYRRTVGEVLKQAQEAIGKTFTGYKGGDYIMHENTLLWAANWGETGPQIIGLKEMKTGWIKILTRLDD